MGMMLNLTHNFDKYNRYFSIKPKEPLKLTIFAIYIPLLLSLLSLNQQDMFLN